MEGGGPRPDSPRETFGDAHGDVKPDDLKADIPPIKPGKDAAELKPVKKLVELSPDDLRSIQEGVTNEGAFGEGRNISGIRTDLMETEADINATMSALRVVYREEYGRAVGGNADGVRSFENVRRNADQLGDLIGEDPRLLTQRMTALFKETRHADAELLVYRDMLVTVNDRLVKAAEVVGDPLWGLGKYGSRAEAYDDFAKHYELLANLQLMYKGVQTNFARTMNSMKLVSKARQGILSEDPAGMFAGGPRRMEELARRVTANADNPKGNMQLTRGGFVNRALGAVNEYWINSILSGPKTHAANVASGLINTAFLPAERFIAGAFRMGSEQGRQEMIEAGLQYVGIMASLRDSLRLGAKALKQGDAILDPLQGTLEHPPAISAAMMNISDPGLAMGVNGIGALVRTPSRFLTAEDEVLKQLNYRGAIRAAAYREGLAKGLLSKPKEFGELISRRLDEATDVAGKATNEDALAVAREATFTSPLKTATWRGGPSIGETLQEMRGKHPAMNLIMPFVRTPTNILRFVWNRTPALNMARKEYADAFSGRNGGAAQAKARAQLTTGAALWGIGPGYAAEGRITGAGPRDPEIRKALMATGWRPYSMRFDNEDGSVSYRGYGRLDPFGMFLGLVADYGETVGSFEDEMEADEKAAMMAVALARNLQNKSYLTGLTGALDALSEPERKFQKSVQGILAGFVPTVLQGFADDPLMREARSVVDGMRRKMPGYSDQLDPVRNILGEKQHMPAGWGPDWMSPITDTLHPGGSQPITPEWRSTVQKDVYDELARQMLIQNRSMKPPPKRIDGVDLTAYQSPNSGYTAYDRLGELTGKIVLGGKTLKDSLTDLVRSDFYVNQMSDGTLTRDGSRIDAISSTLQAYRSAALGQLRQEIPALHWALIDGAQKDALQKLQPQNRPALTR